MSISGVSPSETYSHFLQSPFRGVSRLEDPLLRLSFCETERSEASPGLSSHRTSLSDNVSFARQSSADSCRHSRPPKNGSSSVISRPTTFPTLTVDVDAVPVPRSRTCQFPGPDLDQEPLSPLSQSLLSPTVRSSAPASPPSLDPDWVVVASSDGLEQVHWPLPPKAPVDIATAVMALIHSSLHSPRDPNTEFEAYCVGAFKECRRAWSPASLLKPACLLNSSSRSGLWMFESQDKTLILKRIRTAEKDKLLEIADQFVAQTAKPNSILCSIFGCYRYTHQGKPLFFVLLPNCCPPGTAVQVTYDLKGSTNNRSVLLNTPNTSFNSLERFDSNAGTPSAVALKDNDLQQPLELVSEEEYFRLQETLERDSRFLMENDLFDYSLLVAVASDKTPDPVPSISPKGLKALPKSLSQGFFKSGENINALMSIMFRRLRHTHDAERSAHWQPWRATEGRSIYMKVIDPLSQWSTMAIGDKLSIPKGRTLEYFVMKRLKPGCSLMPPAQYQERFVRNVMRKFTYPGERREEPEPLSPTSVSSFRNFIWGEGGRYGSPARPMSQPIPDDVPAGAKSPVTRPEALRRESVKPAPMSVPCVLRSMASLNLSMCVALPHKYRSRGQSQHDESPPHGRPCQESLGDMSRPCTCHFTSCICARGL